MRFAAVLSVFFAFVACSSEAGNSSIPAPGPSSSVEPGGDPEPALSGEEGGTDSGTSTKKDSGPKPDASGVSADILGTLTGSCGIVKTQLTGATSTFEQNALEFKTGETYDKASLSDDGDVMFDSDNAGGSSGESEVMSFEVLRACEGAKLVKTETDILYSPPDDAGPSSITDILVEIGGKKIGVSVTRVYKPSSVPLTDADAKTILVKKFEGINRSSVRVLPADKWVKQILHVFTASKAATDAVVRVLPTIDTALKADTVVLLTQTKGGGFIYCNPDPALGNECP